MANKYYWLKLRRDFFKRHDIMVIESMDNGEKYVLFYMKLLLESITHDGELRFSELMPYDEKTLSVVTRTDIDIVRSAMKLLVELGMVQILDDETIFMSEIDKMIGKDDISTPRVQKHRERLKLEQLKDETECNVSETFPSYSNSDSLSISKEENHKATKAKRVPKPPTNYEEVLVYAKEQNMEQEAKPFYTFYDAGNWYKGNGEPVLSWKQQFLTWISYKQKSPQVRTVQSEIEKAKANKISDEEMEYYASETK